MTAKDRQSDGKPRQLSLRLTFDADGRAKGQRGKMLRLLNLAAAHPDVPKQVGDVLRAIDDRAREFSFADLTYADIALWVGWSSERSARRWCKAAAKSGYLDFEPVGTRYITDVDRRRREGRDTETLFRFRIQWTELAEQFEPPGEGKSGQPAGQPGQPAGQVVQPAGQSGQPVGQIVRLTTYSANLPPPPPPSQAEAEAEVKQRLNEWSEPLRCIREQNVPPAEVRAIIDLYDRLPDVGAGALYKRIVNAWPGQELLDGWPIDREKIRAMLDHEFLARVDAMTPAEIRNLLEFCAAAEPGSRKLLERVQGDGWRPTPSTRKHLAQALRFREKQTAMEVSQ